MLRNIRYTLFGITPANEINFDDVDLNQYLPPELWQKIFSALSPVSLSSTALVSKMFYLNARSNPVNAVKLAQHFPYAFEDNPNAENYFRLFVDSYNTEYKELTVEQKKWIVAIKENDMNAIRSLDIKNAFLILCNNLCNSHQWLNQSLRDYFFTAIFLYRFNKVPYDDNDKEIGLSMLHWLAILDPSPLLTDNLLPNWDIDVDHFSARGETPLLIAAKYNRLNAAQQFLDRGVDINLGRFKENYPPFYEAASNGYTTFLAFLHERGAEIDESRYRGYTPLFVAAQNGYLNTVIFLLENDANPNDIDNSDNSSALYVACQNGHPDVAEQLIAKDADVNFNYDGYTPLYIATLKGFLDVIKVILPNCDDINFQTSRGATALYAACKKGYEDIVEYLLDHGADPSIPYENGYTALHIAIEKEYNDIVELLVERYPELVEIEDNNGNTPGFTR